PEMISKLKPIYKVFEGWEFTGKDRGKEIPKNMKEYIKFIENKTGAKVAIISLGATREDTKLLRRF
ncbi:MAG: adenylosuccinate synthetase, partial [Thermoplasmata archaeon]